MSQNSTEKKSRSGSEGMIYSAWLPLATRSSISAPFSRISAGLLQERRDSRSPVQNPLEANVASSKHGSTGEDFLTRTC